MKNVMKLFLVIAVLVFSTTAFAQIRPGAFNIGPMFGVGVFEGNQELDEAPVLGLRAGYDFTKNWGIEATINWIPTEYEYLATPIMKDSQCTNVFNYRIEALYHFMPNSRFVPFIALGIGGQTIDYRGNLDGVKDRTRVAPDYGVGIKYFVTDDIAIRGDIRHVMAIGSIYHDLEATVGMAFYFGGKKEAPAPAPAAAAGPAPVQEVKPRVEKEILETGHVELNIEFDFDSADIRPQYESDIRDVASFMNKYPDTKIIIEGHTDAVGAAEYNQTLSELRAKSVKQYIIDKFNIDGKRLEAVGYGESKPIADNNTKDGRQRNRRVEAVLVK